MGGGGVGGVLSPSPSVPIKPYFLYQRVCEAFTSMRRIGLLTSLVLSLLASCFLRLCNSVDKSCQEGAYKTTQGPFGRCGK